MQFRSHPVILSLVLLTSLATVTVVAQEKSRTKAKAAATEAAATPSQSRTLRRLPTGFGALNLSTEQKDQVYAIREEYGAQMQALQEQLAALRMQMEKECEGVLTAAQKKELTASRADKDSEDAPPATTTKAKTTKTSKSSKSTKSSDESADKD